MDEDEVREMAQAMGYLLLKMPGRYQLVREFKDEEVVEGSSLASCY